MNLLRLFMTYAGLLFVALGVVALVIPWVPTTPFILLGGVCLARGSSKHRAWLQRMPLLGRYFPQPVESAP
jgi:uncharacterized membrane protein YbaN (DUF454 family)